MLFQCVDELFPKRSKKSCLPQSQQPQMFIAPSGRTLGVVGVKSGEGESNVVSAGRRQNMSIKLTEVTPHVIILVSL